ncbi:MAG TPA: cyclic nucleotide-binding domain-containing protein [Syntrophales bacterium]|nr:cyclic nucleotide-binding domain-containing protein [Syntrophales bacterium]
MVSPDQLKNYNFFKGFTNEELKKFAEIASEESYKAGVQIWKKGEPAGNLSLLKEGKVLMTMDTYAGPSRPPMQVTVDVVTKGDAMGWSAVVEPYIYTLGTRCIDDSQLINFNAAKVKEMINKDKALGFKFMHAIAKVVAARLTHTEIILVGERGLSVLSDT